MDLSDEREKIRNSAGIQNSYMQLMRGKEEGGQSDQANESGKFADWLRWIKLPDIYAARRMPLVSDQACIENQYPYIQ